MSKTKMQIEVTRGSQGNDLITYQGHLRVSELISFLGHDPRDRRKRNFDATTAEVYRVIQRATSPARVRSLIEYMKTRIITKGLSIGALPPISIGVTANPVFEAHKNADGRRLESGYCSFGINSTRLVLDGLARVTAALAIHEEGHSLPDLPVTIYAPNKTSLTTTEFAQIFHDFNKLHTTVTNAQARGKDSASPYVLIARSILTMPSMKTALSVPKGYREENIGKFVKTVIEGVDPNTKLGTAVSMPKINASNFADYQRVLRLFWDAFANEMGMDFVDKSYLHFKKEAWGAMAYALNRLADGRINLKSDTQIAEASEAFAAIDWSRENEDWFDKLYARATDPASGRSIPGPVIGGAAKALVVPYVSDEVIKNLGRDLL